MKNTAPNKHQGKPNQDRKQSTDGPRRRKLKPQSKQKYRHPEYLLDQEDFYEDEPEQEDDDEQ